MDNIQKVLIKAGRKDLAEEYFEKVAIGKPPVKKGDKVEDYAGKKYKVTNISYGNPSKLRDTTGAASELLSYMSKAEIKKTWWIEVDHKYVYSYGDGGVTKVAGKIKGPGIPDGTGPMKDDPSCPYNKEKEQEEEKE